MTDAKKLKHYIKKAGLSIAEVAQKLTIDEIVFVSKINGECEFYVNEIEILCEILNIPKEKRRHVFFG